MNCRSVSGEFTEEIDLCMGEFCIGLTVVGVGVEGLYVCERTLLMCDIARTSVAMAIILA